MGNEKKTTAHEFSDDPSTPLNKEICSLMNGLPGLLAEAHKDHIRNICREIYVMGFDEGQAYVQKIRQMLFIDDLQNPGKQKAVFPGDPDYPKWDCKETIATAL
jgi:hypothetical protein